MSRKKILLISLVMSLFAVVSIKYLNFDTTSCPSKVVYPPFSITACVGSFMTYVSLLFVPVFIFSLLLLKANDRVFLFWRKFTFIYFIFYLFIVIISPWEHADLSPITKELDAFVLAVLYAFLSIAVIVYKYIKKGSNPFYLLVLSLASIWAATMVLGALMH